MELIDDKENSNTIPVPLHELSARQINQLDPFRLVHKSANQDKLGKEILFCDYACNGICPQKMFNSGVPI